MVRRGSFLLPLAAALVVLGACGGDDDDGATPLTAGPEAEPAPTIPADAEVGTGSFVLGRRSFALDVTDCSLDPALDTATGVTTALSVTASGPDGEVVTVVRSSFVAAQPTVTDTIVLTLDGSVAAESERVDAGGRVIDLREPGVTDRLVELDGDTIRATGVFGEPGARGPAPSDLEGSLVLRCPAAR